MPVSQETLGKLGALSPEDAESALRKHPGYPLQRKVESVHTMLELYRRAISDLAQAIGEFRSWVDQAIAWFVNNGSTKFLFASTKSSSRY